MYSVSLTSKAAKVLGIEKDAEWYGILAEEIRRAMQEEYFTASGRIAVDTQTAMVLALHFNIVPQEFRTRLIQELKAKLDYEDIHLTTGFVGTAYLCNTLSENGLTDYAYTLLLNEDFPSWLYEVNMDATTIWERWNSVLPDVRFQFVQMSYECPYGCIKSSWEKMQNAWKFICQIPFDTTAHFIIPKELYPSCVKVNGEIITEWTEKSELLLTSGKYTILLLTEDTFS